MARVSPAEFIRQVRQEANRVTWPTRRETTISALMVLVMVAVASVFFLGVDALSHWIIQTVLGFGA